MKKIYGLCVALLLGFTLTAQQTLVSKVWQTGSGTQYFFRKSKTVTDAQKNIYVVGETVNSTTGFYDWLVVKYDKDSNVVWTDQLSGAGDCYAADIYIDGSNNVYVTGGVVQTTSDSLDICTRKYNSTGAVSWTRFYAGNAQGNDIGTSIILDGTGSVFVGGTSKDAVKKQDFTLIKYNNSGAQQYVSFYDYNNNNEVVTKISLNTLQTQVICTGGGQSGTRWDLVTVSYNAATGSQGNVRRISGGTGTFHEVKDLAVDNQGNIYLTGSYLHGAEIDIKTVKLDDSLTVLWQDVYSGPELYGEDRGNALKVDNSGNVFVTGLYREADKAATSFC